MVRLEFQNNFLPKFERKGDVFLSLHPQIEFTPAFLALWTKWHKTVQITKQKAPVMKTFDKTTKAKRIGMTA
jgi:hypothetical protein